MIKLYSKINCGLGPYVTKRVIEREQSIMGKIFFIFKVNTVEKSQDLFQ